MAIQFMDNFQQYGTSTGNLFDGVYAQAIDDTLVADPDGVSTGNVLRLGGSAFQGYLRKVLSTIEQTTVGVGFRLWVGALPSVNGYDILDFRDAANEQQIVLELNTTGTLTVKRGATELATTAAPVVTAGAWNHIEMKVYFDQTAGTVEVRVNGIPKIELTGQDTVATSLVECSQIELKYTTATAHFKDLIIWDGNGSANNDFLGDVQIVSLIPTSDNALNWTPSSGATGYNLIDESTPNDTDYISAADTLPDASVFNMSDLDEDVVTVKGLMSFVRMLKTDGGTANVQVGIVSGTNTDQGEDRPITVAATTWMDISENDPDTAAPWTPIAVNALKLRIDRTV